LNLREAPTSNVANENNSAKHFASILLLEEIRKTSYILGSLSHDLQGFYISQVVVSRISEPSTLGLEESPKQRISAESKELL